MGECCRSFHYHATGQTNVKDEFGVLFVNDLFNVKTKNASNENVATKSDKMIDPGGVELDYH